MLWFGEDLFIGQFNPKIDPEGVIIELQKSRWADHYAIEAIDNMAKKSYQTGKFLHWSHLGRVCHQLLKKMGNFRM